MKPVEISALAAAIVMVGGLVWYILLVSRKKIETVVASWMVSSVALILSLITYVTSAKASFYGGSLNAASALAVTAAFVAVWLRARADKVKITFRRKDKWSLFASGAILILWIITTVSLRGMQEDTDLKTHILLATPNGLTQCMLIISYSLLILHFWHAEKNTESMVTWWCVLISSVIGIYTAYLKDDVLCYLYAIRSVVMCGILIYTLYRIGWKQRARAELMYDAHQVNGL